MNQPDINEEVQGPTVDSDHVDERLEARRLRIKKRQDLQKRSLMGDDPSKKGDVEEEVTKSRHQMETSRFRLQKLEEDGFDLVTNIRTAGDARDSVRRIDEEEGRRQRKERFENEAKAAHERFDEITRKWESALQKEIPQDLQEMLVLQKTGCQNLIDEKNKLINEFQSELKNKDDMYVKDLKRHIEEIDLAIDRMNELYKQLLKAEDEEIVEIEKSFIAERTDLLDAHNKKFNTMVQQRREKEELYLKSREEKQNDYEKQLHHMRVQDAEEYNMMKIKLETDVQVLQQQLQQMKATYQLNQEKLEYNFQVLRKRDDENTITKSQQKRKITRLHDNLTKLKNGVIKLGKSFQDENQNLTEEYDRTRELFNDLQKKSRHFLAADASQFRDVWLMNEQECRDEVQRLMDEDRIICQHQLGTQWTPPELSFLDTTGPISGEMLHKKGPSAHQIAEEVLQATASAREGASTDRQDTATNNTARATKLQSSILKMFSPKTLKSILDLLCDESGFLIEAKLLTLLSPLEKNEKSLMKLDGIFTALGVATEGDVQLLANYFTTFEEEEEKNSDEPEDDNDETDVSELGRGSVHGRKDMVHPNRVVQVLRKFIEDTKQPAKDKKTTQFTLEGFQERDSSYDTEYWLKYPEVIPPSKERMWDALDEGLEKYNEVLHRRAALLTETESMRQQNSELRMLLHQYINSKVNQELEIPPTRVLQLELNQQPY